MAKFLQKNEIKNAFAKKYANRRAKLKAIIMNKETSMEERFKSTIAITASSKEFKP